MIDIDTPGTDGSEAIMLAPLRWWQLPAVASMEADIFAADSPWTEETFWSELAQRHFYLAATHGERLVGYAGLAAQPDECWVQTIAVAADHRGFGTGRRLFTALLDEAGQRPVYLEVRTDNAVAIALYESAGFRTLGRRRGYYQPSGADAFTMVRAA